MFQQVFKLLRFLWIFDLIPTALKDSEHVLSNVHAVVQLFYSLRQPWFAFEINVL